MRLCPVPAHAPKILVMPCSLGRSTHLSQVFLRCPLSVMVTALLVLSSALQCHQSTTLLPLSGRALRHTSVSALVRSAHQLVLSPVRLCAHGYAPPDTQCNGLLRTALSSADQLVQCRVVGGGDVRQVVPRSPTPCCPRASAKVVFLAFASPTPSRWVCVGVGSCLPACTPSASIRTSRACCTSDYGASYVCLAPALVPALVPVLPSEWVTP